MPRRPLSQAEFDEIFSKVPRLTVEVVLSSPGGVLLARRDRGPCAGLWSLPGGTVRYGEPAVDAARRVAADELGLTVEVGELLGYLEYPSHLAQGIDWPVGIALSCRVAPGSPPLALPDEEAAWFVDLPAAMHGEQRRFLRHLDLAR